MCISLPLSDVSLLNPNTSYDPSSYAIFDHLIVRPLQLSSNVPDLSTGNNILGHILLLILLR